ncbi:MAG: hypothetical protein IJ443_06440 [Firmicutes bacterium]|nr:hypothetical protein [Bacillota bacterium]
MSDVKQIRLVADQPFYNNMDVTICDFGGKDGALRKRGKITVEYSAYDVKQLKARGYTTLEQALGYYREWMYETVRYYLLTEFELEEGGWEHLLGLIKAQIEKYYEEEPEVQP